MMNVSFRQFPNIPAEKQGAVWKRYGKPIVEGRETVANSTFPVGSQ
jgi:hypothetical protein